MSTSNEYSAYNKRILYNYANELENQIGNLGPKPEQGSLIGSKVSALMPSSKQVGSFIGSSLATTHGAAVTNGTIDFVCKKLFVAEKNDTWTSWFNSTLLGVVRPTIAETAKLMITPKVLPIMQILGGPLGGLTAAGTVALFTILYGRIYGADNNKFSLSNPPPLDKLLERDPLNGTIVDANGNELTTQDLKDIEKTVKKYDTVCKFIDFNKKGLDQLLHKLMLIRSDSADIYYQDGQQVSEEEIRIMEKAYKRLMGTNPMEKAEGIHEMIKLLAKHQAKEDPTNPLLKEYLTCQDGVTCTRDGIVRSQKEIQEISDKREKELQAIIDGFELLLQNNAE